MLPKQLMSFGHQHPL